MLDGLPGIIAQDERIRGQGPGAVDAAFLQTRAPGEAELAIIHDEH